MSICTTPRRAATSRRTCASQPRLRAVEHPLELAEYLLRGTAVESRDSIDAILASGAWRLVGLKRRIPVYVEYWTSWVDSTGAVNFRPDVYGLDRRLDAALRSGNVSNFVINPPSAWDEKRKAARPRRPAVQAAASPSTRAR